VVNDADDSSPVVANNKDEEVDSDEEAKAKKNKNKKKKKNKETKSDIFDDNEQQQQESDPFETGLKNREALNALMSQSDNNSSSSFLPSITRNTATVGAPFPQRQPLSEQVTGSRSFLPAVLPVAPPTRLPPLPGAPRIPFMEKDSSFRRKHSSANKKNDGGGRRGGGSNNANPIVHAD
jgi:hypothetical protein